MFVSEALPDLSSAYALSANQSEEYRKNGHICLRGVCDVDEVAAYRPSITGEVARQTTEKRALSERDTYGKAFLQIMNLWRADAGCRQFVYAERFARIAAELMGVDAVRLYHDQALFKEAGGGHTPWHQDQHYWPLDTHHTITLWMPLVDIEPDMGVMRFASGSHTQGYLGDLPISDASEALFERFVAEKGFPLVSAGAMKAGDVTFHSGWTLHAAPGNQSERVREVMTIIYFADGTRIMDPPDNENRKQDLATWLPGCGPGEPAVSPLNPILYPAG